MPKTKPQPPAESGVNPVRIQTEAAEADGNPSTVGVAGMVGEGGVLHSRMLKLLLWLLLFFFCWPLALLALILYPIVWLLLLPFRLLGVAVDGVLELIKAVLFLPARLFSAEPRR